MFNPSYLTIQTTRVKCPTRFAAPVDGLRLLLPVSGRGDLASAGSTARFAAGDVLVWSSSQVDIKPVNGDEIVFREFSPTLEQILPLFESSEIPLLRRGLEALRGVRHYGSGTHVALACHDISKDLDVRDRLEHRLSVLRVVAVVLAEELRSVQHRNADLSIEDRMRRSLDGLSADDLIKLSVKELAQKLGCSRRHLNRLFQRYFGFSVAGLRMEMRLLKALTMLRDPDAKVTNVARESGFRCANVFNNCFKRRFGASPGAKRRLINGMPQSVAGPLNGVVRSSKAPFLSRLTPKQGLITNAGLRAQASLPQFRITVQAVCPGMETLGVVQPLSSALPAPMLALG